MHLSPPLHIDAQAPAALSAAPFYAETCRLFRYVRDHDFDALAALCDDDFGIVDLGPDGGSVLVETRDEWEAWFTTLFATLGAMEAETDTFVETYDALRSGDLGYAVVRFVQTLTVGGMTGRFSCVVTIIWKRVEDAWVESRWHVSLLSRDLPDGFPSA